MHSISTAESSQFRARAELKIKLTSLPMKIVMVEYKPFYSLPSAAELPDSDNIPVDTEYAQIVVLYYVIYNSDYYSRDQHQSFEVSPACATALTSFSYQTLKLLLTTNQLHCIPSIQIL